MAILAHGQEWHYKFDARGSMVVQSTNSIAPPQILGQPQPQVIAPGELATFSVVMANSANLSYQWRFNGANIGGATNDALVLLNVAAMNEGPYSVVVTNSSGSVTSSVAQLYLDTDRDGLPDSWELAYFGSLSNQSLGDQDGDGVSNLDEFRGETNPTNSASVRFQLVIQSDGGGSVVASPNRLTYTNGELVTLTATPFGAVSFNRWGGDVVSPANSVTVTMNGNKTVTAYFLPLDILWVGPVEGDWDTAVNWSPKLVPGSNDTALITTTVAITVNSASKCNVNVSPGVRLRLAGGGSASGRFIVPVTALVEWVEGSFTLSSGAQLSGDGLYRVLAGGLAVNADLTVANLDLHHATLSGTGALTVTNVMNWLGGTIGGSGRTIISTGAVLNVANNDKVFLTDHTIENAGTTVWTGLGDIGWSNAVITNSAGALFEVLNSASLSYQSGSGSRFDNAGTMDIHKGIVTVNGDYTSAGGAMLKCAIGGTIPGTGYGQLQVAGTAVLDGALGVELVAGFRPTVGNLFPVIFAGTRTGMFADFYPSGAVGMVISNTVTSVIVRVTSVPSEPGVTHTPLTPPHTKVFAQVIGGNWNEPTNWIPQGVPSTGDDVFITTNNVQSSAGVMLTGDVTVRNLTLDNGCFLSGNANIAVSSKFFWGDGTVSGNGTMTCGGMRLTGSFHNLYSKQIVNLGEAVWSSGSIYMPGPPASIYNELGGTFDLDFDGGTSDNSGTPIINAGLFRKTGGAGASIIAVDFTNTGTVEVRTGTLTLKRNGTDSGAYRVSAGATLDLFGQRTLTANASISGIGTVSGQGGVATYGNSSISDVVLNVPGNFVCNGNGVIAPGALNLYGVQLTGTNTVRVNGPMTWTAGVITGSGPIFADGGLSISGGAGKVLTGRTLVNTAAGSYSGSSVTFGGTAILSNAPSGTFDCVGDVLFDYSGSTSVLFNAGRLRKTAGNGTANVSILFTNTGIVEVQAGTLRLNNSGADSGSSMVSAGAALTLASGAHEFSSPWAISGAGSFNVLGGSVAVNSPWTLNDIGSFNIYGGTVSLNANVSSTTSALNLAGGELNGAGKLTVSNVMNWTSGMMGGSGRTLVAPGATLNVGSGSSVTLTTRVLENGGTVIWTGTGGISPGGGAVITNRAGALFNSQSAASVLNGGNGRFDNAGTFRKSVNTGETRVNYQNSFNNYGTVEAQTGTLSFGGPFANSGVVTVLAGAVGRSEGGGLATGTFNPQGSGVFDWTGGTFAIGSGAQFTGTGASRVNGGTVTVNVNTVAGNFDVLAGMLSGTGTLTVTNLMNWTGGTMGGIGRTVIASGATLNLANAGTLFLEGRTLDNAGTAIWTGAGDIYAYYLNPTDAVITNRPGALFEVRNNATLWRIGGTARFDNAGTFRKTTGTGTTAFNGSFGVGLAFNNSGTVEIQTGSLALRGDGAHSGAFQVAGGTMNFWGGTHTASGASSITGAGQLTVSGAIVTLAGAVNVNGTNLFSSGTANLTGNYIYTNNTVNISGGTVNFSGTGLAAPAVLNLSSGTFGGSSVVTIGNVMNWTGGTMSGAGRTVIASGATLNLANAGNLILDTRTLENAGTALWTGSGDYLFAYDGAVITNRPGALFEAHNDTSFYRASGVSRFDNAGTFRKNIGTGTTAFNGSFGSGVSFNNYGTVELRSGIVAANGGYNSAPGALLTSAIGGTTAGTGYGQLQVAGTITLDGSFSVELTNGFQPPGNTTYTVVVAGSRSGSFANFYYPSNVVMLAVSNTPNSVIVRAISPYFDSPAQLPDAGRFVDYTQQITAVMVTNPITYSLLSGALPAGLSLSAAGLISGTASTMGSNTFTIRATDAAGVTIEQAFSLRVLNMPPPGMVGWWRAENNAVDTIGTNHGALVNGASYTSGKVGQTFVLDGVDDYVNIPDSPALRPASVTLEAWAVFNSPNGPVFCRPLGAAADSFALFLVGGTLHGFIHDATENGVLLSSPSTLTLGQWYHVAFSFDDITKEQALYVNGVRVATSQSNRSIGYDNHPVLLGQDINYGAFDFPLNGKIDEAAIYNRALTPGEIGAIYTAGAAGKPIHIPYFISSAQLPDAAQMVGYTQQVTAILGTNPIAYSAPLGGLPSGLSVSSAGVISGIPTVAGTNLFTLRATDSVGIFSDQIATLRVVHPAAAPSGMISWWRAEGNALDSVGTNNGVLLGAVSFGPGEAGQGFVLDGSSGYLETVSGVIPSSASDFTVECWALSATPTSSFREIISQGSGGNAFYIGTDSGNNTRLGDTWLGTGVAFPFGGWHHFAVVKVNTNTFFYIDGTLRASAGYAISNPSASVLRVGRQYGPYGEHWPGKVDEVSIYNRALTTNEVAAIYNAGIAGKHILTPFEQWKLTYLGDFYASDAADPDGDGFSNSAEFVADTNPTNANSYLRITGINPLPAGISLQWLGGSLATQYLQRTFSLGGTDSWVNIFTNLPPTANPSSFTNFVGTNSAQFYRLRVLP